MFIGTFYDAFDFSSVLYPLSLEQRHWTVCCLSLLILFVCPRDMTCDLTSPGLPPPSEPPAEPTEYRPTPVPVLTSVDDISAIVHAVADRIKNPPPQT